MTAATVTKALGHARRLRILAMLQPGPLSVCQLATILGTPVSTMSGSLLTLRQAGLVRERRQGKWIYYRLTNVEPIMSVLASVLAAVADDPNVQRDAAKAATLKGQPLTVLCDDELRDLD